MNGKRSDAMAKSTSIEETHSQLQEAYARIATADQWRTYLASAARFHTYSPNNVLMILDQRSEATQVAGYKAWAALGRQVSKGEHGIKIFAPLIAKDRKTGERTIKGFRLAHVFDVGQTTGEPIPVQPKPALLPGAAPEGMVEHLTTEVERRGFIVEYVENDVDSWNGQTIWSAKMVRIATTGRDAAAQAKTLAHELGHVMLHGPESEVSRDIGEVEAESVAFVLGARFGLDTSDYSLDYIAGWAAADPKAVETTASRVVKASQGAMKAFDDAVKAVTAEVTVESVEATVEPIRAAAEGVRAVTNGWVPSCLVDVISAACDTVMDADMGADMGLGI
jgi:DNA primase